MLRIGTWGSAGSADFVACGWRDRDPGLSEPGIKLVFSAGGRLPEFPGLRTGTRVARGAEEIAAQFSRGMDIVLVEPGSCPAAPVMAAGMWHYGWTGGDLGALAGAAVTGLALAAQPGPCAAEICRDGRSSLDGHLTAAAVRAGLACRFPGGRYRTPQVTVPLESVCLSQEAPCRVLIATCAGVL
ncbi:acyclic terpene utilization AtuA family protein [Nonomuraea sp. NPDC050783]|uniref:acyclic terpene utilization AtuA family protein n=1 Tax=Nonomuraea sp. NPDC050783 TaxID=3154634 RepID=UPI0034668BC9